MSQTTDNQLQQIQKHIKSRYQLQKKIGEGGTSTVYLAKDLARSKEHPELVAVKVLKWQTHKTDFEKWKYRIMKEVGVLRNLKSTHIVKIYDYQFDGMFPYFVMEYCDGETIRQRLIKIGPRGELESLTVIERVLKTLSEIHNNSLVHRDLKPSNIIINGYGDVKILDFGIVYEHNSDFEVTNENSIVGSIQYLAPELISAKKEINFLCDFYSVGLILYELLTADQAFRGKSITKIIEQITQHGCPDIDKVLPGGVHKLTQNIIKRATAIDPKDRFQTLSSFLRHINHAKFQIIQSTKQESATNKLKSSQSYDNENNIYETNIDHNTSFRDSDDIDATLGTAVSSLASLFSSLRSMNRRLWTWFTKWKQHRNINNSSRIKKIK